MNKKELCKNNQCYIDTHVHYTSDPNCTEHEPPTQPEEAGNRILSWKEGGVIRFASPKDLEECLAWVESERLHQRQIVLEEVIKEINPLDLVEPCNPDCTPEEHAYHQGTWDAHLKLEKILDSLSKLGKEEV